MKVRARVKRLEHLPEWAKCCDDSVRDFYRKFNETDLAVEIGISNSTGRCSYCGANQPSGPIANFIVNGEKHNGLSLELFDLDEGPLESA